MRHEYIDIPAQPEPLQEMLWRRQTLSKKLAEQSIELCRANEAYNNTILEMITLNGEILKEEER